MSISSKEIKDVPLTASEQLFPGSEKSAFERAGFSAPGLAASILSDPRTFSDEPPTRIQAGLSGLPLGIAGLTGALQTLGQKTVGQIVKTGDDVIDYLGEPTGGLDFSQVSAINDMIATSDLDPSLIEERVREIVKNDPDISGVKLKDKVASEFLMETGVPSQVLTDLSEEEAREAMAKTGFDNQEEKRKKEEEAKRQASIDATKEDKKSKNPKTGGVTDLSEEEALKFMKKTGFDNKDDSGVDPAGGALVDEVGKESRPEIKKYNYTEQSIENKRQELIEKFKKEFTETMPELPSRDRTGIIMRAFLDYGKTGDIFSSVKEATQAIEKQNYNQEVLEYNAAVAASQYAIEKTDQLMKDNQVLDNFFYTGEQPIEYNGKIYKKNDFIRLSRDEQRNVAFKNEIMPANTFVNLAKNVAKSVELSTQLNEKRIKRLGLSQEQEDSLLKDNKDYIETAKNVALSAEQIALLRELTAEGRLENVTGGKGYAGTFIYKINNFFGKNKNAKNPPITKDDLLKHAEGIKNETEKAAALKEIAALNPEVLKNTQAQRLFSQEGIIDNSGRINEAALRAAVGDKGDLNEIGKQVAAYQRQAQFLANLMIRDILGEGSKNVSNIDRQLASEIVGLFTGIDLATQNPNELRARFNTILRRVESGYYSGLEELAATERKYQNKYRFDERGQLPMDKTGKPIGPNIVAESFLPTRKRLFGQIAQLGDLPALKAATQDEVLNFSKFYEQTEDGTFRRKGS